MRVLKTHILLLAVSALLGGCPSENPLLVQPPPAVDSMVVACLSVVVDGQARRIVLGDTSVEVRPGERTSWFVMPRDSLQLQLWRGAELRGRFPLRLLRRMVHLVVLTSRPGRDTVAVFLQPLDVRQRRSTVRLLHVADDDALYGLQLGCPASVPTSGWVSPLLESGPLEVSSGEEVFSVVRSVGGMQQLVGSWRLTAAEGTPRSVVVWGAQGALRIGVLADDQPTVQRLEEPQRVVDATARVRVVNISTESVTLLHGQDVVAAGIAPRRVGAYEPLRVCQGVSGDTLLVRSATGGTLVLLTSLEPFRHYTVVVMDSAGYLQGWVGTTEPSGQAQARLLHAAPDAPAVRVVVGAMGSGRLRSGSVLAEGISFGRVTEPQELPTGVVPLMVQTVALPSFLPAAALLECAPDMSGLLCLLAEPAWRFGLGLAWIHDRAENVAIEFLAEAVPVQLVQGLPGQVPTVTVTPVLRGVAVPYRTVLATALPRDGGMLQLGAQQWRLIPALDSLGLVVLSAGESGAELFRFSAPRSWEGPWGAQRRFLNASDVPAVDVLLDTVIAGQRSEVVHITGLPRGGASGFEVLTLEYRFSFRFRDSRTGAILARADNISLPLGRRYSVVFVGSRMWGYAVLIHQEL